MYFLTVTIWLKYFVATLLWCNHNITFLFDLLFLFKLQLFFSKTK